MSWHHGVDHVEHMPNSELLAEYSFEDGSDLTHNSANVTKTVDTTASKCLSRYVKIVRPAGTGNTPMSIYEVKLYNSEGVYIPMTWAHASIHPVNNNPGATIDGNMASRCAIWATDAAITLSIDMGDWYDVGSVEIFSFDAWRSPASASLFSGNIFSEGDQDGTRCYHWDFDQASSVSLAVGDSEFPPSLAPSPAPTFTAMPTVVTYPAFSRVETAPVSTSESSVYFDGSAGLTIPNPLVDTADFIVSFWFKADSDHSEFTVGDAGYWFEEGAGLVDSTEEGRGSSRDWGVSLTKEGVSFGLGELKWGAKTQVDSVLRSHSGLGKNFAWEASGNGDPPASDASWHFVEAKRAGRHMSLSIDNHVVALTDHAPAWTGGQASPVVRFGCTFDSTKCFKGWLDEVKFYRYNARAQFNQAATDRDGDGAKDLEDDALNACGGDNMHRYVQVFHSTEKTFDIREVRNS